MKHYLGIDIGSISVKAAVVNDQRQVLEEHYLRIRGEPKIVAEKLIHQISSQFELSALYTTGSGGKQVDGSFVNEIIALSSAAGQFLPGIKTVIEMGGEDAKLLLMENGKLADFATNSVCAAGTGSFLDQQASRLGYKIGEFSQQALRSEHPPRIAGRCTVFAKSDMIHLQQKGTPDYEIIAGLCLAVARNFVGTVGRGKKCERPIAFLGGVAANQGMRQAFIQALRIDPAELIVPQYFASMGAIGAVLHHLNHGKN
jgi:predicted CoA-substrate-specific enzyme activase